MKLNTSTLRIDPRVILTALSIGLLSIALNTVVTAAPTPSPTPAAAGSETPRSNYYSLPDDWNMPSCEKVLVQGKEILSTQLPIFKCVGGKSSGNTTLDCNKDWTAAYAESVEVPDFPLLQFLSAVSPQGTKDNNIQPLCYYDITNNSTDTKDNYILANFSNDYPGLLTLKGSTKTTNISFPRLGTATNCGVVEGENYKVPLKLDVQLFNQNMPQIPDKISSTGGDDFFSWIFNLIKSISIFQTAIESNEPTSIKTVQETLAQYGINKAYVCGSIARPVTKINISDKITPTPEIAQFVVNQKQEIMNFTTTEMCDLDFITGRVIDATCTFNAVGTFTDPGATVHEGQLGMEVTEWSNPPITTPPTARVPLKCADRACNWSGSCFPSQKTLYAACRAALGDVNSAGGDPKYLLDVPGFDTLSIQGANMTLSNTVNVLEQINGPYDINYGEDIGIKLDVTRKLYNLNSTTYPYDPNTDTGPDYDPTKTLSPLRDYISYAKTPYNYNYLKSYPFQKVDQSLTEFYFPYLGKLPYLLQRIAIIHSNTLNDETSYTMLQKYLGVAGIQSGSTDNASVLAAQSTVSGEVYKPQLKLCKDLTETEKLTEDCYGQRANDPIEDYLCDYNLGANCNQCTNLPNPSPAPNPGGNCENLGSITGKVAWPVGPTHAINVWSATHVGSDLVCSTGDPVYAIADGEVVFVRDGSDHNCYYANDCDVYNTMQYSTIDQYNGWWGTYGNVLGIKYKDGVTTMAHLKNGSITVKVGDCVTQGQQVAEADSTGNSTGSHLHFEMRKLNCIDYSQSCTINNNDDSMLDASLNQPGSGSSTGGDTSGGSNTSEGSICPAVLPLAGNYNCLIYNTAMAINKSGYLVSPEAIYGIIMAETGGNCGQTSSAACTGDANQISAERPGGTFAPLPYTTVLAYPGDDGIGISQAVSWRMYEDIPKYVSEADMTSCMSAIGVNVSDSNPLIKDPASKSSITRLRVGDSLCYIGLLMKSYNSGIGFTQADRFNLDKFGQFGLYYNKSSNYTRYLPYFSSAVTGKIFASCEGQQL